MYKPTIGLEIHTQLKTKTKMFCDCSNNPEEKKPNVNVCPVCFGHPGTLPTINKEAVEKVLLAGIALNCQISKISKFDRKNYFYPDLPKGYQISQYDQPLCLGGYLEISIQNQLRKINLTRIHLEEDTGRLSHIDGKSLIDFNRASIPLMELVTEPDIFSSLEAKAFCEELQLILRYLDVSNADMERGQMRAEVNISLSSDPKKLGTKVEVKNLNSFKAVEKSIEYEIKRQTELLENGENIIQETRGFDEVLNKTVSQRIKEEAMDYRYFPEPDLPPLNLNLFDLEKIKRKIIELPAKKRERFKEEYQIPQELIEFFIFNQDFSNYFEEASSELLEWLHQDKKIEEKEKYSAFKLIANYLTSDLQNLLKENNSSIDKAKITPENFADLISLVYKETISSKIAKIILEEMFKTGNDPHDIIKEKNLEQIDNKDELNKIIELIINENPAVIEDYKKGKSASAQFLIGQIMKKTKGRANPETAKNILSEKLKVI